MTVELVNGYIELFQGNHNAIGTEAGGCFRLKDGSGDNTWQDFVRMHLVGHTNPIGVYPMVPFPTVRSSEAASQVETYRVDVEIAAEWSVHWGCIDFDEGEEESWPHAVNVRAVLEQFGITAWIERSRSKGFHVWVFADSWVPAKTMRQALLAACQLVGAPTKEINPKQAELSEGQLGNYVRLPYPAQLMERPNPAPTWRRSMVSLGDPMGSVIDLEDFVEQALASRTNEAQLEAVADLYKRKRPPSVNRPRSRPVILGYDDLPRNSIARLSGLAYTILTEGPKEGVDRSTTLWKLATRIHDDGTHTFEEALDIMVQADLAWGKFMERGDNGERELTRMLEKIWDD